MLKNSRLEFAEVSNLGHSKVSNYQLNNGAYIIEEGVSNNIVS